MAAFLTFKHLLLKLTESFGQCTMDWLNVLLFKCDSMTLKWQWCLCRWVVWKKRRSSLYKTPSYLCHRISQKSTEKLQMKNTCFWKSKTISSRQQFSLFNLFWFTSILSLQSLRIQCAEGKHVFIIYERPFINYLLYAQEITINVRH